MKRLFSCIAMLCSVLCINAQVLHSAYDVNGDGKVDIQDLTHITHRIIGKIKDDVIHQSTIKIDTIHYQVIVKDTTYEHSTVHVIDTLRSFFKDSVYQYTQTIPQTEKTTYTINGVEYPMPEVVDLGLPSGNLWATCNLGAISPEDYGLYFAWGETMGYTSDINDGHSFDWTNYKWCKRTSTSLIKYCYDSDYGTVDNLKILEDADDAANFYLGSNWHIGSLLELFTSPNTSGEWCTRNGIYGYKITSTNGNTLFLPAAGCREDNHIVDFGNDGYYWNNRLSTFYNDCQFGDYLDFGSYGVDHFQYYRCCGLSIRPVFSPTK